MARTSRQIQGDIYRLLVDSTLSAMISGGVYRAGMRPRDSRLEDAEVRFTTGLAGQVQTGVVTVNIWVPDIDPWGNGVLVEDSERTEQLEAAAQEWFEAVRASETDYNFRLQQTIYTEEEPYIKQHFVVVRLAYELFDGETE